MSLYANTVAADRSFPLTPAYYQRTGTSTSVGSSAMPMTVSPAQPPHHQNVSTWPQYFTESPLLPPPSTFSSYISEAGPSTSPPAWQNSGIPLTFAAASGIVSNFHEPIDARPCRSEYQTLAQSPPLSDYPTSSQRTILPPSPPPQLTTFSPSYGFRNRRNGSPSSHASTSDYGTGTKGWESPGPNTVEELHYTPSLMDVVDADESEEQITEAGSRHPSVPASTTTSSSSHPSVKLEPDDPDGCFIMELSAFSAATQQFGRSTTSNRVAYRTSLLSQSLAPPTEVPLRATGASKEMRLMMGVFRLNPFAMHSLSNLDDNSDGKESLNGSEGGTEASWCGEGQPLQEEPLMFEFQLNIDGLVIDGENERTNGEARSEGPADSDNRPAQTLGADEEAQLRSFSPSFELHPDDVDGDSDSRQESYLRSDINAQGQGQGLDRDHERDQDQDRHSEIWGETEYGNHSEVGTSSTTTTRSVHTPLNDSPQGMQQPLHGGYEQHHNQTYTPSPSSVWDAVNEQYQAVEETQFPSPVLTSLPPMAKSDMVYGHPAMRVPRLHTTTSHPYLRKSLQNHQASHSHSQSLPHPPPQSMSETLTNSQPGFSLLHLPTHHSHPSHAHIRHHSQQSHTHIPHHSPHPHHFPPPNEFQQRNHVPGYDSPGLTNTDIGGVQEPLPSSYMRPGRGLRGQEHEYDDHPRAYSARHSNHDVVGYVPSSEASLLPPGPVNIHGGQTNLLPNRRWSLPDTGATAIGHGIGGGGPFLTGM